MAAQSREERQPSGPDSRFADALRPLVETALKRSVRDEPQFWAQTISPILGPAIRMAVASAPREMAQTINQLLENSFSARVLAIRPDIHVLYMSGYARDSHFKRSANLEDCVFLSKPFTPRTLADRVREALRRRARGR